MATRPLRSIIEEFRNRIQSAAGKVAPERLAPPLDAVLLDEIAGRLDEVHTELGTMTEKLTDLNTRQQAQVPQGFQDQTSQDVTSIMSHYDPVAPLFSVDIKNDGDVSVFYSLNDPTKTFVELTKKEARTVSFPEAKITRIYFKCKDGESSSVRLTGTF